jgi:hypothetical protein
MRWIALIGLVALLSCGPPANVQRAQRLLEAGDYPGAGRAADAEIARDPGSAAAWRIKIRAALLAGDSAGAVAGYNRWRQQRGAHDEAALERMGKLTLWRGLVAPSAKLKVAAIRSIEQLEIEALADEIGDLIASDDDYVAATAAVALLRSHPYAGRVAADLLSSADERARAAVVEGIGRKITEVAAEQIRAALSDRSVAVRRNAVVALARLGAPEDTSALATMAREDAEKEIRARALRALAGKAYDPPRNLIGASLRDPFVGVRLAALELASKKLGSAGRQILLDAARDADLRIALRSAVLLGPGPGWRDLIDRAMASEAWPIRAAAVGAAVEALGRDGALALAGRAIVDSRREVRLAAARLLLRLDQRDRAVAELAAAATAADPDLGAAVELARRFDDRRGVAAIERATAAEDRETRAAGIAAHRAAGHISDALVAAIADRVPELRLAAAAAILDVID